MIKVAIELFEEVESLFQDENGQAEVFSAILYLIENIVNYPYC